MEREQNERKRGGGRAREREGGVVLRRGRVCVCVWGGGLKRERHTCDNENVTEKQNGGIKAERGRKKKTVREKKREIGSVRASE